MTIVTIGQGRLWESLQSRVDPGIGIRDTDEAVRREVIYCVCLYGSDVAAERKFGFRWETLLNVPMTLMNDEIEGLSR